MKQGVHHLTVVDWSDALAEEIWCIIVRHLSIPDVVQLEQTCRRLRTICVDPHLWTVVARSLLPYDHTKVLRTLMSDPGNAYCMRRILKGMAIFQSLPTYRSGDIIKWMGLIAQPYNLSASYRMAAFLPSIPRAWKILYFSALFTKPTHVWRMVRHRIKLAPDGRGWFQIIYQLTSRKRRRNGTKVTDGAHPTRVLCEINWNRLSESIHEVPVTSGAQGVIAVHWDHPCIHKCRWSDIILCDT